MKNLFQLVACFLNEMVATTLRTITIGGYFLIKLCRSILFLHFFFILGHAISLLYFLSADVFGLCRENQNESRHSTLTKSFNFAIDPK